MANDPDLHLGRAHRRPAVAESEIVPVRQFEHGEAKRHTAKRRRRRPHRRGHAPGWELLPASRASGVWLVGSRGNGVVALAAPGVPLGDERPEALEGWRLGSWTAEMLDGGIDVVTPLVEPLTLVCVVDLAPAHWHGWVRDVTRAHLHHLVRFAEPAIGDTIHGGRAEEAHQLHVWLRLEAGAAFPGEGWHRSDRLSPIPPPSAYPSAAAETADWLE